MLLSGVTETRLSRKEWKFEVRILMMKRDKLTALSARAGLTHSPLSITQSTLANRGRLSAHVCGRRRIALFSECAV